MYRGPSDKSSIKATQSIAVQEQKSDFIEVIANDRLGKKIRVKCR